MKRLAVMLACIGLVAGAGVAPAERLYRKGEIVRIHGRVVDADGVGVPGVSVVLTASRSSFKLLRLKRQERQNPLRLVARTNSDGEYALEWSWNDYYNTFDLMVALPVRRGGQEDFEVFHRREITDRLDGADAVEISVAIEATEYLAWLRRYFDGRASEDEVRIYREMGRPDRLDELEVEELTESSWWYFEAGKVYRFRDGGLAQVEHFDPVEPIE